MIHEHCQVRGCTGVINPAIVPVCSKCQQLVPPYWLKRWKAALKQKAKARITRDRLAAFKEVEFVRATCIGAAQREATNPHE